MTIDQASTGRVPTVMHVRCPDRLPERLYRLVLEQLAELSPVVQALPPTAALVELKGALRYHGVGADMDHLGQMLRVRTLTRYGTDLRIGIGPTISVAATASAQVPEPGGVLVVAPDQAAEWLAGLPVQALHDIAPRQAGVLHDYGIHTVGLLAAVPAQTVQRLLGGHAGRLARDRARGTGPRPVVPRSLPASASVSYSFARHTLDGPDVRAALLRLVVQLARVLRRRRQVPQALTLTFAGTGRWSRTHRRTVASGRGTARRRHRGPADHAGPHPRGTPGGRSRRRPGP